MKSKLTLSIVLIIIVIGVVWFLIPTEKLNPNYIDNSSIDYNKLNDVIFDVKTYPVIRGDLNLYINANGIVKASQELDVTSNISGVINTINIFEGKKVNKGDLLIGLDDREYELNLSDARVKVTDSKIEYGFLLKESSNDSVVNPNVKVISEQLNKLEEDFKSGKVSEQKYNSLKDELEMKLIFSGAKKEEIIQNKSGLTSAINSYKKAKLNYEHTKIYAPFSGEIGDFDLVVGKRINAGEKLFKLLNNSNLKVDVGVLESDISKIKIGNIAKITSPVFPELTFWGFVSNLSPYIDNATKTCKATIQIKNASNELKPGMFVNVFIQSNIFKNRILIPKEALLVRDRRNLVFVVENNLAKWKYIQIGEQNDKYIEVKEGLEQGEQLIIEGQYNLAHDSKVRVLK